ncbi:DUF6265 family protein [Henriciella aquimarina]|uniref:DUF6265 family protein n=1 Tax=Henriciella aquimarina TaxID=545261 RepID=UPI0009FBFD2C|nr:DUF6265 family protein [Henriciella aquimarina]
MKPILCALAMTALSVTMVAHADEAAPVEIKSLAPGTAPAAATIEDLAWLEGRWTGGGLGGVSEEIMSAPSGGQIMGMFRQSKADGTLQFYEFYHFAEEDGSVILRIKHFHPDLTGWEEKDEREAFPLVALGETAAYFDGLTFALVAPGELRAAVRISDQGRADFSYSKAD